MNKAKKKRLIICIIGIIIILLIILQIIHSSVAIEKDYVYRCIDNGEYILDKNNLYQITAQSTDKLRELTDEILSGKESDINVLSLNSESYEVTDTYIRDCGSEKIIFMVTGRECAPNRLADKIAVQFNTIIKRESREIGVLYCSNHETLFEYVKEQIKYRQINLLPVDDGFYIYEMVCFE